MFAEFKYTLRKLRGTIIGWGIGLFIYDLLMSSMYSSIQEMGDQFQELLDLYPKEIMAFMPSIEEFTTPIGFYDTYFFAYMTIIVGIFATSTCAKLIVGDEEKGILDLIASHPISRTSFFWSRILAFSTALILILVASWIGWVIPAGSSGIDLSWLEFGIPFIPFFSILILFGSLALFLSLTFPSARFASGLAGALLIGNFLLVGMSGLNEKLLPIYEMTPLFFTQGAKAIEGINWSHFGGIMATAIIFALLAWWRFEKRDIRVGGEAGWKLSLPKLLRKKA